LREHRVRYKAGDGSVERSPLAGRRPTACHGSTPSSRRRAATWDISEWRG
jgi:hypothetical protein